jgi:hypothetical protein
MGFFATFLMGSIITALAAVKAEDVGWEIDHRNTYSYPPDTIIEMEDKENEKESLILSEQD